MSDRRELGERELDGLRERFVAYGTALSDLLGLSQAMAQIAALLYASPRPVSPTEICRRLKLTKGTVSVYLRLLEEKKVVVCQQGGLGRRGKAYVINPRLWEALRERMLGYAQERMRLTDELVREGLELLGARGGAEATLLRERIQALQRLNDFSQRLLIQLPSPDASPLSGSQRAGKGKGRGQDSGFRRVELTD